MGIVTNVQSVVKKTANEAKYESPPYLRAYRETVGAQGIPDIRTATPINVNGRGSSVRGKRISGRIINLTMAICQIETFFNKRNTSLTFIFFSKLPINIIDRGIVIFPIVFNISDTN